MTVLSILGATGSIGENTLDVVRQNRADFKLYALGACRNVDRLYQQCMEFVPRYAVLVEAGAAATLKKRLQRAGQTTTTVLEGEQALCDVAAASDVERVMAAIVGIAGLKSAYAAVQAGKVVLLANKEALVSAGRLFMDAVSRYGATLVPVDSEHNAIFQCLPGQGGTQGVSRIVLTASGGPFRDRDPATLSAVKPQEACAHPNWSMGAKISVDSATMVNKALEVIEAFWLFKLPPERLAVLIHPQSIVHSLVHYEDGSYLAQLGSPDMRTPITYALYYPDRGQAAVTPLDLTGHTLQFEAVDSRRFPVIDLVFELLKAGNYNATIVLNAANEVLVEQFLAGQIGFTDIVTGVQQIITAFEGEMPESIEAVIALDQSVRTYVRTAFSFC